MWTWLVVLYSWRERHYGIVTTGEHNFCLYPWITCWRFMSVMRLGAILVTLVFLTFFFTCNPSAAHSPKFQVMFGDTFINLTKCFQKMVSCSECILHLAKDPVTTVDFFEFMWWACFKHLLGWDLQSSDPRLLEVCLAAFVHSMDLSNTSNKVRFMDITWSDLKECVIHQTCILSYEKKAFDSTFHVSNI